ncbi:hypothetical protein [Streptomyces sp. WZ-12]|uniref:hypothetical protein n=1 Tax=Streptomyces sp. WZ-12 TaxID=3030210 RepID=UPI002380F064|nr:hypothetical protein [Streptomyces sp. WZ-12]
MIRGKKLLLEVEISENGKDWHVWPNPGVGYERIIEVASMHTIREAEMATEALGKRTAYVYQECEKPDGLPSAPEWFRILGKAENGHRVTRARYRRDAGTGEYACVAGPEILS